MAYKLSFETNPSQNDIQVLGEGIMAYAKQNKGQPSLEFFAFFIRDENNKILGGCNGNTLYGSLYIDQLWITESLRNKGYGAELINAAEQFGKDKGCTFATVNTMDWEALEFYKKMGYEIEFERHGYSKNSTFYFLRKSLPTAGDAP